ncbi:MAG TPA: trigger factor, partial [Bryobacteraceae bacterium]
MLIEGCKHALEITVPLAEVDKEAERAAAQIQTKARLPGFRPGKAPLSIVKTRFAGDIRQDVMDTLVPRFLQAAVQQENLQMVGRPSITDVHFHAGEPLRFKAEFEVAPTFELGEYRGVTITYDEPVVTDVDVDERVEQIRDQKAQYVNEDPRPLVDGDYAVVSLESLAGTTEKVQQDEVMLKIGDEATMKEFSESLRGASPEEAREFEVTYPEEYERPALAGKTVKFRAVVKAVRRKEPPDLNDEFAKDLGDFKTLEELKETIRKSIFQEREYRAKEEAKQKLIEQLVDAHDFPVPDAYVDRQIQINVESQLRTLAGQGVDPAKIKLDWEKVRESQK